MNIRRDPRHSAQVRCSLKTQSLTSPQDQVVDLPTPYRLLYSYKETRELLGGVPQSTFAMWIAKGIVVPVTIGPRRCLIKREDILALAQGITMPKAG